MKKDDYTQARVYNFHGNEHRFGADNKYLGFWRKDGSKIKKATTPFDKWHYWDEVKHALLLDLGFKLKK